MSSYLSNILTNTTSKYASIRRTLLNNEDDGDTEDDSHISRVLRAYYTEKHREFPPWLPPDPNDRRATTPQPSQSGYGYGQPGGYGQQHQQQGYFNNSGTRPAAVQQSTKNTLNDLWDTPSAAQPIQSAAPQSLRNSARSRTPQPASSLAPPPQARPLPSQRAGSYQSVQPQQQQSPSRPGSGVGMPGGGGGTAQERLKQRLWGGRSSPAPPG
ncbi:hypothetical protein MBLNU230_g8624t1 [Neophaeotheca triangularis]